MSIEEPTRYPITWPTLSQPFITPISMSVQPKRNFYNGTTNWVTWASRKFNFSSELECLPTLNQPKVFTPLHASLLPTSLCSMSVWQTETKAISRQEKLSGQGCSRQLEEGQALSRTMHCCGSLHLLYQGKTFHFKRQNQGY